MPCKKTQTPPLHTNVGKKQAYYYRSISPTQIAGLADAILEKVFGFEQVPDMVTLTANAQGHFDFKAQFMYEDSIPFPQKRSTASKEKEKQKVKDIALAFFRTANEKVKANKQPKLENQDYRPMFQDRDVDRGAFPSDFPDLFPIQYLEWQSTEPIFHAEYPKNIHYYEVRFRVELPVIAKQRNIIETPKTETVQNPETPVARLSSNAPTNHTPQTQKLLDTFLGNATQTPTVKATVQNEYIVLHINPDDKRYEIMGVESCFVHIAGQETTDLLEMAGENIGLYFLQEGNMKVPYWTAEGKVAASGLVKGDIKITQEVRPTISQYITKNYPQIHYFLYSFIADIRYNPFILQSYVDLVGGRISLIQMYNIFSSITHKSINLIIDAGYSDEQDYNKRNGTDIWQSDKIPGFDFASNAEFDSFYGALHEGYESNTINGHPIGKSRYGTIYVSKDVLIEYNKIFEKDCFAPKDINRAAHQLRFAKLILHELAHYVCYIAKYYPYRDDPGLWDNGAGWELKTFGYTYAYPGGTGTNYAKGFQGGVDFLKGKNLFSPFFRGILYFGDCNNQEEYVFS